MTLHVDPAVTQVRFAQVDVIPSRVSGREYGIGPVCLSVSALMVEPFDLRT